MSAKASVVAIAVSGLVTACQTTPTTTQTFGNPVTPEIPSDQVKQLTDKPGKFVGKNVKLEGEVEDIIDTFGFTVELDNFGPSGKVFVINNTGKKLPIRKDDKVTVTGPVNVLVTADVEEEYDYDLPQEVEIEYENTPFVIAKSLTGYWQGTRPVEPLVSK